MRNLPPAQSGPRSAGGSPFGEPDPDLDIVRLAHARQTRRMALGILYERFRDRVYNTALRIVADRDDAADVMQEVFILLFRNIRRFRARANFASWVYRITVNASLDHLRRRRRTPTPGVPALLLDAPSETPDLSAPECNLAQLDLSEHVQDAMSRLSDRLRIVVVLRYLEGLSYADIAEILDVSLGTVKSRLNRAHTALRDELGSRYDSGSARA
jgi:RNA polymerase sigma-70 factor (ECF subfamily)